MFYLREPYIAPIRQAGVISSVAGPFEFVSRMLTSAPRGFMVKTPPRAKPLQTAAPTEHAPPEWYTHASDTLDVTMTGVTYEIASHKPISEVEDVFFLDRLIEKLRAWDRELLSRADARRSGKPFS